MRIREGKEEDVVADVMDLLTTVELARRWHTTEQAIYAARYRGDGPRAVRVGRRLLFRLTDVLAWEERRMELPG